MKRLKQNLLTGLWILLSTTVLLEAICATFFYFYSLNTVFPFFTPLTKTYYNKVKSIAQYEPNCGIYSEQFGYALKPGTCEFNNLEFHTRFFINSAGLRDDEASLKAPEIIVLGDSYAMGWGVEQNETFSDQLEQKTGKRVLNTGISSYGTARELLRLDTLDTQSLKYLIIQYCNNDKSENKAYFENPSEFIKNIQKKFLKYQKKFQGRSSFSYIPFAFTLNFFDHVYSNLTGRVEKTSADRHEEFADAIKLISIMHQKNPQAKIILFEAIGHNKNDPLFDQTVLEVLKKNEFSDLQKHIRLIKLSDLLNQEDYFIVDSHINRNGHRKIANAISQIIGEMESQ